jgi:hypothetical protein
MTDKAGPDDAPRYIATVPTEPTFMYFDPDRPSVPAPVPMGPIAGITELQDRCFRAGRRL